MKDTARKLPTTTEIARSYRAIYRGLDDAAVLERIEHLLHTAPAKRTVRYTIEMRAALDTAKRRGI